MRAATPIDRSEQPDFLIIPDWGLEVNLQNWGLPTHSDKYSQELQKNRKSRIEEEMRLLYVAVTRAQNAVIFVGSGRKPPKDQQPNPDSEFYCWKDEIRCAWPKLQKLGAIVKN